MYEFIDKGNLIRGRCICNRCNVVAKQFYYNYDYNSVEHQALCINCALELRPPKWQIIIGTSSQSTDNHIEPVGYYHIWDETHKRQEVSLTLVDLITCGWFIRKVVETHQKVPNRIIKKIDLEYHGKLACVRFKDHYKKIGLEHIDKCDSPFCEFLYEKTHPTLDKLSNGGYQDFW